MKRSCLIAFILLLPLGLLAQPMSYSELVRDQNAVAERLNEARSFLAEAGLSFERQLYNYSFELLAQSSSRLSNADHRLERQIDEIANMRATIFRVRDNDREELTDRRRELRQRYFELNRQAQSLSRDILPFIGVDMDDVRWMLSALRHLAENHPDAGVRERARRALERIEAALERGDPQAIDEAMRDGDDVVNEHKPDVEGEVGRRPDAPAEDPRTRPEQDTPVDPDRRPGPSDTPADRAQTPPDHLNQETVDWLVSELDRLCRNIRDPELRRQACDLKSQLDRAIDEGNWNEVTRILDRTRREIIPSLDDDEIQNIRQMPVNINGRTEYFPPDFGRPGVGTRYIGGRGARLIEESQEFIELVGEGSGARWEKREGDKRTWRFNAVVTGETPTTDGRQFDFRLNESNREGNFSITGWKVVAPDGRSVADGRGDSGSVELTESGAYTIEFSGETEWGSPFRIQTRVEIAL